MFSKSAYTVLVSLLCLFIQAFAHVPVDGKVTAAFGPVMGGGKERPEDVVAKPIIGFGLQVIGDIDSYSSLQIELEVLPKRFSLQLSDTNKITEQVNSAQVGLGYRRWIGSHFSSSLLVSSVYPVGDPTTVEASSEAMQSNTETSAHRNVVYGAKLGLQYEPGDAKYNNPTFDFRYYLPFTPMRGERSDFFGLFIAYRFPAH